MSEQRLQQLNALAISEAERRPKRPWGVVLALSLVTIGGAVIGAPFLMGWERVGASEVTTTQLIVQRPGAPAAEAGVLTANGYVATRQTAAVAARTAGTLAELFVDLGDRVRRGQELARLERDRAEVSLESARAALAVSERTLQVEETELANARKALARQQNLFSQGISTEQELDDAEARMRSSESRLAALVAEIAAASASRAAADVELEHTIVRAPFDGIVVRKDAEIGEAVGPGFSSGDATSSQGIVTIANLEALEAQVDVAEAYISRVHVGDAAQVVLDAYADRPFRGKVRQIVPTANREKASIEVRVDILDPDASVLPEMGARITFLAPEVELKEGTAAAAERAFLDRRALRREGSDVFVFVLRDEHVSKRAVRTGADGDRQIEILAGLAPTDRVILEAPADLGEGDLVKVLP
ncbi:MAG: efflux RND transporter periplasmic adaptor subunit [Candidatus Schekmanbacteria bacterium]|nr:efflux RND transporter periplasmic adaptor subunit [Candidatus Schekmanbacteria bacterium]